MIDIKKIHLNTKQNFNMKNFNEFYTGNNIIDNVKKILEAEGNFDVINNDLLTEIKEFLLTEYPSSWWAEEFQNRLPDYISEEEYIGDGDIDDESTWKYEGPEDAYQNLCSGGAIEYDLFTEIRKDIRNKFHLTDEEYDRNKIDKIVEDHMCNMCDWYDHMLFGENAKEPGDFLGIRKGINDMMSHWDDKYPTDDGHGIKL